MATLTIKGTYKYRIRTRVLWFWIVEPWKTVNIDLIKVLGPLSAIRTMAIAPIPGVPVEFKVRIENGMATLNFDVIGQAVWEQTVPLPLGVSQPFKGEPLKGCLLDIRAQVLA